jgi:hypothetical protein
MEEIRVPPHVATTTFNETAVLLDLRKNAYYALNDSAADFWKFITQMGSFESALKEVSELYEDSSDVIRKDMEELVSSLIKAGLLERV